MHKKNTVDSDPEFDFEKENFHDKNGNIDYEKLEQAYLKEFATFPIEYRYKGIEFRCLYSKMKMSENWQRTYLDNFFDEFCDRMENVNIDAEVNFELGDSCNQFNWSKNRLYILEYLQEVALQAGMPESECFDLTDQELIEKYPSVVSNILRDFETIIRILYKNYSYNYGEDLSLSFFASALDKKYCLPISEWIALEEAVKALK
jgi:hypothetical protein